MRTEKHRPEYLAGIVRDGLQQYRYRSAVARLLGISERRNRLVGTCLRIAPSMKYAYLDTHAAWHAAPEAFPHGVKTSGNDKRTVVDRGAKRRQEKDTGGDFRMEQSRDSADPRDRLQLPGERQLHDMTKRIDPNRWVSEGRVLQNDSLHDASSKDTSERDHMSGDGLYPTVDENCGTDSEGRSKWVDSLIRRGKGGSDTASGDDDLTADAASRGAGISSDRRGVPAYDVLESAYPGPNIHQGIRPVGAGISPFENNRDRQHSAYPGSEHIAASDLQTRAEKRECAQDGQTIPVVAPAIRQLSQRRRPLDIGRTSADGDSAGAHEGRSAKADLHDSRHHPPFSSVHSRGRRSTDRQETAERETTEAAPLPQQVVIARQQAMPAYETAAFWERSYLSRFRLRPMR